MTPDNLGVRHAYANINGIRMHFVEKGEGPLVVLIHGFPEMWWSWRYQIRALADAGFRVIAPDMRGYNETDAKGPYDIDTLRDDVLGLLDHLGAPKAMIVAHDWGGAVAWHLASTHPSRVAKLVVMNCPHPVVFVRALMGRPSEIRWSQIKRSWYMFFFQLPVLPEWILTRGRGKGLVQGLQRMAFDKSNFGERELLPLVEAICKPGRATGMINWYRALFRGAIGQRKEMLSRDVTLTMPTLLVWAMQDLALGYDDVVPGVERYVPGIEIVRIEDCGHFVQQEQPEKVNAKLLEFLKQPVATAPPNDVWASS